MPSPKPRLYKKLPPSELAVMADGELKKLKDEVRGKMAIGHPPYTAEEWDGLCALECQLHLEAVNRHFLGTKVKKLRYN